MIRIVIIHALTVARRSSVWLGLSLGGTDLSEAESRFRVRPQSF